MLMEKRVLFGLVGAFRAFFSRSACIPLVTNCGAPCCVCVCVCQSLEPGCLYFVVYAICYTIGFGLGFFWRKNVDICDLRLGSMGG